MSDSLLPILQNPAVRERTSQATRTALEERAKSIDDAGRYLAPELYILLQQLVAVLLPQDAIGTDVDIAACIDQRLRTGTNAGWRFADLPSDGEAYTRGLTAFSIMLQQTPIKTFDRMPLPAREGYVRCVLNGEIDGPAQFPLSKWLGMVKTDAVRFWLSHPSAMQAIEYYGFADGATGETDGPTTREGWASMTPDTTMPFEHGIATPAAITGREA